MKATCLASASRKKTVDETKEVNNVLTKKGLHNEMQNMSRLIVMYGSAKRKPLNNMADYQIRETIEKSHELIEKYSCRRDFSELRIPLKTTRHSKNSNKESTVTNTCKALFECLKPYIDLAKSPDSPNSTRHFESISANECSTRTEAKASRKLQIYDICEYATESRPPFLKERSFLSSFEWNSNDEIGEFNFLNFTVAKKAKTSFEMNPQTEFDFGSDKKTTSSEDFVKKVFSKAVSPLIESDKYQPEI